MERNAGWRGENILMRDGEEFLPRVRFIDDAVYASAYSICDCNLVQLTIWRGVQSRQCTVRGGIGCPVFVGAVDGSGFRVEGQPAWHFTAGFEGLFEREVLVV